MGGLLKEEKVKEGFNQSYFQVFIVGERSFVLLDIDFDADNQDEIVRTVKRLSELMSERNIDLAKGKT